MSDSDILRYITTVRERCRGMEARGGGGTVYRRHIQDVPIAAITGIGCRLPGGVHNLDDFWRILVSKTDTFDNTSRFDLKRVNEKLARYSKSIPQRSSMIQNVLDFDNHFFRVSNKEATSMDPQQRMILEVVWEALEHSGTPPSSISGSDTGVFVGAFTSDYKELQGAHPQLIDAYTSTGTDMSLLANRVSFFYNLHGPSITIDTACSSSLTALGVAIDCIRSGRCRRAIVAGVNVCLSPMHFAALNDLKVLSPDGIERPFDINANGYVRAEAAIAIVLTHSEYVDDNVTAWILGSECNHDGSKSSITTPATQGQISLMTSVCNKAHVLPCDITYVEAHGTGTRTGDPIEARAIGAVLGRHGDGGAVRVGSSKGNVGHAEGAAGLVGLIKVCNMIKHRTLVPTANFDTLNPVIAQYADEMGIKFQDIVESWNDLDCLSLVNSFGFGGANATVLLSAPRYPPQIVKSCVSVVKQPLIIPLSAESSASVSRYASVLSERISNDNARIMARLQCTKREHFISHRAVVIGKDASDVKTLLGDIDKVSEPSIIRRSNNAAGRRMLIAVFSGQGTQWKNMGVGMFEKEPVFREAAIRCDLEYSRISGISLLSLYKLFTPETTLTDELLAANADLAIPAITFFQLSVVELLKHWGLTFDVCLGHSLGEIGACYASGLVDLREAIIIAYHRGRLMKVVSSESLGMAAVGVSCGEMTEVMHELGLVDTDIVISAINTDHDITISGTKDALNKISNVAQSRSWFMRQLRVSSAFHSPHMDSVGREMVDVYEACNIGRSCHGNGHTQFYSTVTGGIYDGNVDGQYWWSGVRQAVLFNDALNNIEIPEDVKSVITIDIAPSAALSSYVKKSRPQWTSIPVGLRNTDDELMVLTAAASLYVNGVDLNWLHVLQCDDVYYHDHVDLLPRYQWDHSERHFKDQVLEPLFFVVPRIKGSRIEGSRIEGSRIEGSVMPGDDDCFYSGALHNVDRICLSDSAYYLREYSVSGIPTVSFSVYISLLMYASCHNHAQITGLMRVNDVVWPIDSDVEYDVKRTSRNGGVVYDFYYNNVVIASGTVSNNSYNIIENDVNLNELKERMTSEIASVDLYDAYARLGVVYGASYANIERIYHGEGECYAVIRNSRLNSKNVLDPTVIDCCLQTLIAVIGPGAGLYVPVSASTVYQSEYKHSCSTVYCTCTCTSIEYFNIYANFTVYDEHGHVVMVMKDVRFSRSNVVETENKMYTSQYQSLMPQVPYRESTNLEFIKDDSASRVVRVLAIDVADRLPDLGSAFLISLSAADSTSYLNHASFDYIIMPESVDVQHYLHLCGPYGICVCENGKLLARNNGFKSIDSVSVVPNSMIADLLHHISSRNVVMNDTASTCIDLTLLDRPNDSETFEILMSNSRKCIDNNKRYVVICDADDISLSKWNSCVRSAARSSKFNVCRVLDRSRKVLETAIDYALGIIAPLDMYTEICCQSHGDSVNVLIERVVPVSKTTESQNEHINWCADLVCPRVLQFYAVPTVEPGDDDVVIRLHSVLMDENDAACIRRGDSCHLGMECSGTIEKIGKNVRELTVGQDVVTVNLVDTLSSHIVVNYHHCAPVSERVRSVVLLHDVMTVMHAVTKAKVSSRDTVIVVDAESRLSQIAIRIIEKMGAEILAVTSPGSQLTEVDLNVEVVNTLSSDKIADVVVCSSDHDHDAAIDRCAPCGRFVYLGNAVVDGDALIQHDVVLVTPNVNNYVKHQNNYVYKFINQVFEMFRSIDQMADYDVDVKSINDLEHSIDNMNGQSVVVVLSSLSEHKIRPYYYASDRCHVVIGHCNGIGADMALHMVQHGAANVLMLDTIPMNAYAIKKIRKYGAKFMQCDQVDSESLANALRQSQMPVAGVILLNTKDIDVERMYNVLVSMEYVVLVSSLSSLLDGDDRTSMMVHVADRLRARSVRATALRLPDMLTWSDVKPSVTASEIMHFIDLSVTSRHSNLIACDFNQVSDDVDPSVAIKIGHLIKHRKQDSNLKTSEKLTKDQFIQSVVSRLSTLLSMKSDAIIPTESLNRYGLDSLSSVELSNWLQSELNLDVCQAQLLSGPSVSLLYDKYVSTVN